jgi:hypothetical protein
LLNLGPVDDFRWGVSGQLAAESFAAREEGPDTVHTRAELLARGLAANEKCLMWTILAAKETTFPEHEWPVPGEPVFRTYSASYLYDGTHMRLLDASARTMHAGGGLSNEIPWNLPGDIPL